MGQRHPGPKYRTNLRALASTSCVRETVRPDSTPRHAVVIVDSERSRRSVSELVSESAVANPAVPRPTQKRMCGSTVGGRIGGAFVHGREVVGLVGRREVGRKSEVGGRSCSAERRGRGNTASRIVSFKLGTWLVWLEELTDAGDRGLPSVRASLGSPGASDRECSRSTERGRVES